MFFSLGSVLEHVVRRMRAVESGSLVKSGHLHKAASAQGFSSTHTRVAGPLSAVCAD